MAMLSTDVEVKGEEANTWYAAKLIDVMSHGPGAQSIRVRFEDQVWPDKTVSTEAVRPAIHAPAPHEFSPRVGDYVEVYFPPTEKVPAHWQMGRVKAIKESFYFVDFERTSGSGSGGASHRSLPAHMPSPQLILEKDKLRPINARPCLDLSRVQRELVDVPAPLYGWAQSRDGESLCGQVQQKAGLVKVQVNADSEGSQLVLIGEDRALRRARLLLDIHFRHLLELHKLNEAKEKRMRLLTEKQRRYEDSVQEEFTLDHSLMAPAMGYRNEKKDKVEKQYHVEVRVIRESPSQWRVRIFGADERSVKGARAELECVQLEYPVSRELVGWVIGKGGQHIREIKDKSGLISASYNDPNQSMTLVGLQSAIDDAVLLLDEHTDYYKAYKDMDREHEQITESFKKLDVISGWNSGRGGRGGGRGGGGGGGGGRRERSRGRGGPGAVDPERSERQGSPQQEEHGQHAEPSAPERKPHVGGQARGRGNPRYNMDRGMAADAVEEKQPQEQQPRAATAQGQGGQRYQPKPKQQQQEAPPPAEGAATKPVESPKAAQGEFLEREASSTGGAPGRQTSGGGRGRRGGRGGGGQQSYRPRPATVQQQEV